MGRSLRNQKKDRLYFVTTRCFQQRYFMVPSPKVNRLILGWLGRALERFPEVKLHGIVCLSNHLHAILSSGKHNLHLFVGYWLGNVAKALNDHLDRKGTFFERRYASEAILDDISAKRMLAYLILNPVAAELVDHAHEWPGISSVRTQVSGEPLVGRLPDKKELKRRRRRGEVVADDDFVIEHPVTIAPLPEHEGLSEGEIKYEVVRIILGALLERNPQLYRNDERGATLQAVSPPTGRAMGVDNVMKQNPTDRPAPKKRTNRPLCHCSTPAVRAAYKKEMRAIRIAYDAAMRQYRRGRVPNFPVGTCPPGWMTAVAA